MKGKVGLILMVLAILVVVLTSTGCASITSAYSWHEDFDDWEKVEWDSSGLAYLLEEDGRGKVLCLGGTGKTLPEGSDKVGIDLKVPQQGAIISFDYTVCPSPGTCFEVIEPGVGFKPWLEVYEKTDDWESASFIAPDADNFHLLFSAKREVEGSSGIVVCLDNIRFQLVPTPVPPTPTPMGDTAPTPIKTLECK